MHIFRTVKFDSPTYFKNKVSQFMAGIKCTVAKEMQEQGVTYEEGGSLMVFPVFKRLCQLMSASGSADHVYAS